MSMTKTNSKITKYQKGYIIIHNQLKLNVNGIDREKVNSHQWPNSLKHHPPVSHYFYFEMGISVLMEKSCPTYIRYLHGTN